MVRITLHGSVHVYDDSVGTMGHMTLHGSVCDVTLSTTVHMILHDSLCDVSV